LHFPAVAPVLRGLEPYTDLTSGLTQVVRDPAAVLPWPYDWRLSVAHNARLLADVADDHLRMWRKHPRGSASARLVLVGHSMGGLVARYFTSVLGGAREVRAAVTLGTPFRGAVKAAHILNAGRGAPVPLPRRRLRRLAATMPGLHDLLPSYRCVTEGNGARRLTASDVASLGGNSELAVDSARLHEQLAAPVTDGHRAVVGLEQPTMQSMTLRDGVVTTHPWAYVPEEDGIQVRAVNRGGDGTVYRESAVGGAEPLYVAQTHGALASTAEVIKHVCGVLTEEPLGPWLGEPPQLGLALPDVVAAGEPFEVTVPDISDPAAVNCRIVEAATGAAVAYPVLLPRGDSLVAKVNVGEPGVYRVAIKGEAFSPVTELLMVAPKVLVGER
jgi:pimeloyl-ACP methyl ester carboxylesterase